jgi:hypothetical protein
MMTLETATADGWTALAVLLAVIGGLVSGVLALMYVLLVTLGVGRRTRVQTSGESRLLAEWPDCKTCGKARVPVSMLPMFPRPGWKLTEHVCACPTSAGGVEG